MGLKPGSDLLILLALVATSFGKILRQEFPCFDKNGQIVWTNSQKDSGILEWNRGHTRNTRGAEEEDIIYMPAQDYDYDISPCYEEEPEIEKC